MNKNEHSRTPIGLTDFRNQHTPFFIKDADRLRHIYVLGKSGQGKTNFSLTMAISDIQKGKGMSFLDPHGDAVNTLLNYIPKERVSNTVYFNATDVEHPLAFNPLYNVAPEHRHIVASNLLSTFKKIWADSWGPRLEYILHQCLLTLLYYPQATLLDIQPLLTNKVFREEILMYVTEPLLKTFWYSEYDKYPPTFRIEAISPILNKTGIFITNPILRNIVGQQGSIDMKEIVDSGKILLCNLSKGAIGEEVSSLLGSMILSSIQHAVLERSNRPEEQRKPFYCYVDECHSFIHNSSSSVVNLLAECRKFGLSLFLAHQYLDQLPEAIRSAIFGNVGTIISFQVGNTDAEVLAKEFHPVFSASDFINLPKFSMYIKLAINGATSKGFSALSLPLTSVYQSFKDEIIAHSRARYGSDEAMRERTLSAKRESIQETLFEL